MGQTFFVMVAEVVANWVIFIPLSYLLGSVLGFGLIGAWSALPFYVIVYTVIIFIKFKYGKQSKISECLDNVKLFKDMAGTQFFPFSNLTIMSATHIF